MLNHSEDLGVEKGLQTNFITMDIETIQKNNKLIPYLICAYNGTDYIISFNNDQKELFSNFIKGLLTFIKNNKTITIYAHNFSNFDGVFLLKHLLEYGKVEPLLFNGKLITIKLTLNIEGYNGKFIIFKDSLLILPISLRNLALIYKVSEFKGIFPYKLSDINYNGIFPRFEYFKDITIDKYLNISQEFNNQIWNFKEEAIKYCELDCISLHQILTKFSVLI